MADMDYLKKLQDNMMGINQEQEVKIPFRPESDLEENVNEAENAQSNEQAKSPYMKNNQELAQDNMEQAVKRTPTGQAMVDQQLDDSPPIDEPQNPQQKLINMLSKLREDKQSAVSKAREDDRKREMYANIAKGLGQLGAAAVQASTGAKVGLQPFQPIKAKDTASAIGKEKDAIMKGLLDEYKMMQSGGLSPYQEAMLKEMKLGREAKDKRAELAREEGARKKELTETRLKDKETKRQDEYVSNKVIDLRKTLSKDDRFKQMTKEGLAFDQVDNLVKLAEKGNQTAFGALGTKMARAMGEVGVLTDADVVRYVRGGSLSRKAADTLNNWMEGKPSDASIDDIKQISRVLKEIHGDKMGPIYDEYAKTAYENLPISRRESYQRLSIPMPKKLQQAGEFFKKNKAKLKEMGINTEKEAEEYLMKQGKL